MQPANANDFLRHALAAVAYRTQKALRGAGPSFSTFDAGHSVRRPHEIVQHMESVIGYAVTFFDPVERMFNPERCATFTEQIASFHQRLDELGKLLADGSDTHRGLTPERLLQGPIAGALTHAGQRALLRRMAGEPVPKENFIFADITSDRLGPGQAPVMPPASHAPHS